MEFLLLQDTTDSLLLQTFLPKIVSYSNEISETLYVAAVSPFHKGAFSEKLTLSLIILSCLYSEEYTRCLKNSEGITNFLPKIFLISFD